MIKIKLNDVVNATDAFNNIMQQSIKGSSAFKVARLARELDKEMETFNSERQKIIQKYGKKDENGQLILNDNNQVSFDPEDIDTINNELNSLLETELEINADKIPATALEEFKITPKEMIGIEKFFEE